MTISDNNREQLGEGVIYKDIVPLKWRNIAREELEFSYLSLQDANEELLRFITTLDDFHVENQDELGSTSGSDLSRIEFKLNLWLSEKQRCLKPCRLRWVQRVLNGFRM